MNKNYTKILSELEKQKEELQKHIILHQKKDNILNEVSLVNLNYIFNKLKTNKYDGINLNDTFKKMLPDKNLSLNFYHTFLFNNLLSYLEKQEEEIKMLRQGLDVFNVIFTKLMSHLEKHEKSINMLNEKFDLLEQYGEQENVVSEDYYSDNNLSNYCNETSDNVSSLNLSYPQTKMVKNANAKYIMVGDEIHGKWSPPRTAHGIVKTLGKTKVKIALTEDFTKSLVKGMCVDIYFQNTWKTGRDPPENWKENFKWKTNNSANKGTMNSSKKDMTLKTEYSLIEIIKIAMEYEKIKSYIPNGIDKYVDEMDTAMKEKQEDEKKEKKDKFMKEQMALLWEQNKDEINKKFDNQSVQ